MRNDEIDVSKEMLNNNRQRQAGYQWLTPVILAFQEAEIRRI
jgi:hypothetical protein